MSKKKAPEQAKTEKKIVERAETDGAEKRDGPEQKLAEKEKEIDKLKNDILIQMADFENARKRIEKLKREDVKYASLPLMRELLTVVDNLELALSYAKEDDPMREGVSLALDGMKKSLEQFQLKPIKAVGEEFDPSLHEAVYTVNDPEKNDEVILEEQRVGYILHDRVVRASIVVVNNRRDPDLTGC